MAGFFCHHNNNTGVKKKQLYERKHCEKHCFLVVGLEKGVFREGNWIAEEIENYEPRPAELNTLLARFYAEIENKHDEDYEPESMKVMIASLDRHLKNK